MSEMATPFITEDTQALLDEMFASFADAPTDPTVSERREGLAYLADLYGPSFTDDEKASLHVENRLINGPNGPIALRIYVPRAPKTKPPVMLHIHGGGWVLGDPDAYAKVCMAYCLAANCILVDVDYRRSPENKFPAGLDDCVAALDWVAKNARKLGGDPNRLMITGDSAGGNLAAATCLKSTVKLALQILVYPVISARAKADYKSRKTLGGGQFFLREFDIKRAETEYFTSPDLGELPFASPIVAPLKMLQKVPPALIITASLDPLRDEAIAYGARLEAAGVRVQHEEAFGTIHGFILFGGRIAQSRDALRTIGQAVNAAKPRAHGLWRQVDF